MVTEQIQGQFQFNMSSLLSSVHILQLDHYPVSTYTLPEASDTQLNLVKSIFLGKVFGKWSEYIPFSHFYFAPLSAQYS